MKHLWAFFLLCLIFSPNLALSDSGPGVILDRVEASVNSQLVLRSDLEKFRRTVRLRTQIDPLFRGTALSQKGSAASDKEIVEYLIDEKLILNKFPVQDSEVEQRINSIQTDNRIDRTGLRSALSAEGYDFSDYFEMMRAGWSKRTLIGQDIQTKVSISDDDVRNHYYNHVAKGASGSVSNYHLQMITVSFNRYKSPAAARTVIERAYSAIKSGETWEEVSSRFSDHPSAQTGGDLGSLTEDQVSPAIRQIVKNLTPGQISPIQGNEKSAGFYLIRLVNTGFVNDSKFDQAKEQIREQLLNTEYQHQISLWLERQRQGAFIHRLGESPIANLPIAPKGDSSSE